MKSLLKRSSAEPQRFCRTLGAKPSFQTLQILLTRPADLAQSALQRAQDVAKVDIGTKDLLHSRNMGCNSATPFAQAKVTFRRLLVPWPKGPLHLRKTTFSRPLQLYQTGAEKEKVGQSEAAMIVSRDASAVKLRARKSDQTSVGRSFPRTFRVMDFRTVDVRTKSAFSCSPSAGKKK